jgi:hypothetical protein
MSFSTAPEATRAPQALSEAEVVRSRRYIVCKALQRRLRITGV